MLSGVGSDRYRTNEGPPGATPFNQYRLMYLLGATARPPDQALKNGFKHYSPKNKPIVPVSGEIGCARAGERTTSGSLVAARGLTEAHFYVDVDDGTLTAPGVLAEIKAL